MDHKIINSEELEENINKIWTNYQLAHWDPRANWDLAWGVIKKIFQQEKKNQVEYRKRWERGNKLQRLRIVVEIDQRPETLDQLSKVEIEAHRIDMQDAIQLRQMSRVRWVKWEEAPTKYFFL